MLNRVYYISFYVNMVGYGRFIRFLFINICVSHSYVFS